MDCVEFWSHNNLNQCKKHEVIGLMWFFLIRHCSVRRIKKQEWKKLKETLWKSHTNNFVLFMEIVWPYVMLFFHFNRLLAYRPELIHIKHLLSLLCTASCLCVSHLNSQIRRLWRLLSLSPHTGIFPLAWPQEDETN